MGKQSKIVMGKNVKFKKNREILMEKKIGNLWKSKF